MTGSANELYFILDRKSERLYPGGSGGNHRRDVFKPAKNDKLVARNLYAFQYLKA